MIVVIERSPLVTCKPTGGKTSLALVDRTQPRERRSEAPWDPLLESCNLYHV